MDMFCLECEQLNYGCVKYNVVNKQAYKLWRKQAKLPEKINKYMYRLCQLIHGLKTIYKDIEVHFLL